MSVVKWKHSTLLLFLLACTQEVESPAKTFQEQVETMTQSQDRVVAINGVPVENDQDAKQKIEELLASGTPENPSKITLSLKPRKGDLYTKELIGFRP